MPTGFSLIILRVREWLIYLGEVLDRQIPERLLEDPETARRARLMTRFGSLGSIFGLGYALFYLLIAHYWGAGIIVVCTIGVAISPLLMGGGGSIARAGDFFSAILTLGFLGLCLVEGGVHGHAIAWLVSVPLCALILTGIGPAVKWVVIAFLAAALIIGLDLAGIHLPVTYDEKWNSLVSAAGYLGLVVFMFILGFIFESGRSSAFARMHEVLVELEETNVQLVAMNTEKNEFLGIAAHDLKNPLTVILGSGELLKLFNDTARTPGLADAIIGAAGRMHKLITNLLDVNAIEEGRFASNLEKCDFGDLLRQCVEHNLAAATRKEIKIEMSVPEDIYVRADGTATSQILDNLISNAVKYSPLHTTVRISLGPDNGNARVQVHDEGPGISPEDQKKLFQKFSRLSAIPTGGESSTGLGLAIAKRLAEAMAGTVDCESLLGGGATFSLRLPLWVAPPDPAVAGKMGKTARIIVNLNAPGTHYARR